MSDESPLLTPSPSTQSKNPSENVISSDENQGERVSPLTESSPLESVSSQDKEEEFVSCVTNVQVQTPDKMTPKLSDEKKSNQPCKELLDRESTSPENPYTKVVSPFKRDINDANNEDHAALLTPEHPTLEEFHKLEADNDHKVSIDRWRSPSPEIMEVKGSQTPASEEHILNEEEINNTHFTSQRSHDPLLSGCSRVDIYKKLNKISEGTYGTVYRAQNKLTRQIVALKHIKYHRKLWQEGFPITSLREISILLELNHPNIVLVKEVVVGSTPHQVFMVMEYVEHELKALLDNNILEFSVSERKCLLLQMFNAINYLHKNWVLHRDLKTSNLLYTNKGELKLCDFGMARKFGDPIRPYTHNVITLWYRAPELILGQIKYTQAVDMWSAGCIFGEMILRKPLFPGHGEEATLQKIFQLCGYPNETTWPGFCELPACKENRFPRLSHYKPTWREQFPFYNNYYSAASGSLSEAGLNLLQRLLEPCPDKRITALEAIHHPYFTMEKPAPQPIGLMPTVPETNSQVRRKKPRDSSLDIDEQKLQEAFHDASFRFGERVNAELFLSQLDKQRSQKEISRTSSSRHTKLQRIH